MNKIRDGVVQHLLEMILKVEPGIMIITPQVVIHGEMLLAIMMMFRVTEEVIHQVEEVNMEMVEDSEVEDEEEAEVKVEEVVVLVEAKNASNATRKVTSLENVLMLIVIMIEVVVGEVEVDQESVSNAMKKATSQETVQTKIKEEVVVIEAEEEVEEKEEEVDLVVEQAENASNAMNLVTLLENALMSLTTMIEVPNLIRDREEMMVVL